MPLASRGGTAQLEGMSAANPTAASLPLPGQRGPENHAMRARIVETAHDLFRQQGYARTSMADIAAALGVTPAYLYKFFSSKLAVCEAVCARTTGQVSEAVLALARSPRPAEARLRALHLTIVKEAVGIYFAERRLHDMVSQALQHQWDSIELHKAQLREAARIIVADGMAEGAFDRALDPESAVRAVFLSMLPFAHPNVLEHMLNADLEANARSVADLLARGLRPRDAAKVTD
jgi:AcrR family transcriptional regulator